MSEPETVSQAHAGPWPVLDLQERRVLGVLVEKAKTTPDAYPLSVNALVSGCNQKSNRDPILDLMDHDVEDTLARCQKKGLVFKITGGRVVRWRHALYDGWVVDKVELAVLAELLLRGPQTEGELRTRASRMEALDDLDHLRRVLRPLVERNLVLYLTAEDRRGAVLTHGFHDPRELEALLSRHASQAVTLSTTTTPPPSASLPASPRSMANEVLPGIESTLTEACSEIDALKHLTADLQRDLKNLQREMADLKQSLGVP